MRWQWRWERVGPLGLVFLFGLVACGGGDRAGDAREVAALRTRLEALEQRVSALEDQPSAAPSEPDAMRPNAAPAARPSVVHWDFDVSPEGADITVDGELVEGFHWQGPGDGVARRVRIRRAGFRIVEQVIPAERDLVLRYALEPGRGVQHLPAPRATP